MAVRTLLVSLLLCSCALNSLGYYPYSARSVRRLVRINQSADKSDGIANTQGSNSTSGVNMGVHEEEKRFITELDNQKIRKNVNKQLGSDKYRLEMDTYKDESKVYLDEEKNKEEIVFRWSNVDTEKEAVVLYIQGMYLHTGPKVLLCPINLNSKSCFSNCSLF